MRLQHRKHHMTALAGLLLLGNAIGVWSPDDGQAASLKVAYQYAVKVTCSLLGPVNDGELANGVYRTVINVHNPNENRVAVAAKVVLPQPVGASPSDLNVTPFKQNIVGPNAGIQFTCGTVAGFFCPIDLNGAPVCIDFAYIDGFVVLYSPAELDVTAVYTARPREGEVTTMDVEQSQARKISKTIEVEEQQLTQRIQQNFPTSP